MKKCRVCGHNLDAGVELSAAPSLSSVLGLIDAPTVVHICDNCSHAQSEDLANIRAYYAKEYRISLDSEANDQLLTSTDLKTKAYRTQYQAQRCIAQGVVPQGANVLDFGAAQARSLHWLAQERPDISPHVFDVSDDYLKSWQTWLKPEQIASHYVPPHWHSAFDLVTSYFVIEHVADPIGYLKQLAKCLKPGGHVFISLPNVDANFGDMIVADHLNHFTEASLRIALTKAGLAPVSLTRDALLTSFFVAGRQGQGEAPRAEAIAAAVKRNKEINVFWTAARQRLQAQLTACKGVTCAIYGAGFYGSWLRSTIGEACEVVGFFDMNEKLAGTRHMGLPVMQPSDLPAGVSTIFVGLNPQKARAIIGNVEAFRDRKLSFVWLD